MPRQQPTLHEAMEQMLRAEPDQTATLERLAAENARLDLYRQDGGDGSHPKPFQFKLRANVKNRDGEPRYSHFEFVQPNIMRLVKAFNPNEELVQEHSDWLRQFRPRFLRDWQDQLNDDKQHDSSPQGAMFEAATRRLLQGEGIEVEPNQPPGPDFLCRRGQSTFYVEASALVVSNVTNRTGVPHGFIEHGFTRTGTLAEAVKSKADDKISQCLRVAETNLPTLLALGYFHLNMSCMLDKGEVEDLFYGPSIYMPGAGFVTHLETSAFFEPKGNEFELVRKEISALLICGFGVMPNRNVFGMLPPKPDRPFDRMLLPEVEFCRLKDSWESGKFEKEWI